MSERLVVPAPVIYVDGEYSGPDKKIVVVDYSKDIESDEFVVAQTHRISLFGAWTLKQYANPVPCGASVRLYPDHAAARKRGTWIGWEYD